MEWEDRMRLQNKVALLTGVAAAIKGELMGFGDAAAPLFARAGAGAVPHSLSSASVITLPQAIC
jgi:NAD(P)-dependent dehydrogenase (short-subunit alcohol dehydrogenase family)